MVSLEDAPFSIPFFEAPKNDVGNYLGPEEVCKRRVGLHTFLGCFS